MCDDRSVSRLVTPGVAPLSLDEEDASRHDEPRSEEQSPDRNRPAPRGRRKPRTTTRIRGKDGDKAGQEAGRRAGADPKKSSPWVKIIGAIVVVLAIAGGSYYYFATADQESTDDAYTDGRSLTISPKVAGYVIELLVNDNQRVKAGDVLARIDPRDYLGRPRPGARQPAHRAGPASGGAAERRDRAQELPRPAAPGAGPVAAGAGPAVPGADRLQAPARVAREATTQQNVDQSTAQLQLAQGQVTAAQAAVQQAEPVQQNIGNADQQVSQIDGQMQAGAGAAGPGGAEPQLRHHQGAAGRLDHQAQHRGRQLPPGRRLHLLHRDAGGLGDRQLQGKPARPHEGRPARARSRWTPIPT